MIFSVIVEHKQLFKISVLPILQGKQVQFILGQNLKKQFCEIEQKAVVLFLFFICSLTKFVAVTANLRVFLFKVFV